ncbi:hypothetical protein SAMN05444266_10169 [Chitinophaga jiangningensis]|uniref:YD repeat-containing protein n=1 Tax=Chitinophaga jiangningensis TaxID=1419482 RepID=A0A1M6V526_9BACT|nr:hypothetical protein [Chitinophaga jiangningensis]SHK76568.1 hypothetical protein SAMN05444266_10169 [Chitinophaga jiangningensis]
MKNHFLAIVAVLTVVCLTACSKNERLSLLNDPWTYPPADSLPVAITSPYNSTSVEFNAQRQVGRIVMKTNLGERWTIDEDVRVTYEGNRPVQFTTNGNVKDYRTVTYSADGDAVLIKSFPAGIVDSLVYDHHKPVRCYRIGATVAQILYEYTWTGDNITTVATYTVDSNGKVLIAKEAYEYDNRKSPNAAFKLTAWLRPAEPTMLSVNNITKALIYTGEVVTLTWTTTNMQFNKNGFPVSWINADDQGTGFPKTEYKVLVNYHP